jgi:hypothetical protein
LTDFYTSAHGSRYVKDEGKLLDWLEKLFTYQKAVVTHSAAYATHAREVFLQQGEIGPGAGTGISGGAELDGSCDNNIESELKQELCSRRLRSGGTKPQLPLDDDAKPADAQGESSNYSEGSGNDSDNE